MYIHFSQSQNETKNIKLNICFQSVIYQPTTATSQAVSAFSVFFGRSKTENPFVSRIFSSLFRYSAIVRFKSDSGGCCSKTSLEIALRIRSRPVSLDVCKYYSTCKSQPTYCLINTPLLKSEHLIHALILFIKCNKFSVTLVLIFNLIRLSSVLI